jgi:DNA-binding transcriptional regulator YhcF (GntR family)
MQLWFAHASAVSLREQLVTQIILGILSEDLSPGQRLPSTRELARRFRVHPNTISAGYRQLERERWVEFRRGSGVFVSAQRPEAPLSPGVAIDQKISELFRSARKLGVPWPELRARLRHWLDLQPPDHILVIEPDPALRAILVAEIACAMAFPVSSCGLDEVPALLESAIPVALPNRASALRQRLPPGVELLTLQVRSVPASLGSWLPAPAGTLVGVASAWSGFLKTARTVLTAAGFDPDSLLLRDSTRPHWQRGLKQTAAVVCDTVTAAQLPARCRVIVFPLLSDSSLAELRRYHQFLNPPLGSKS